MNTKTITSQLPELSHLRNTDKVIAAVLISAVLLYLVDPIQGVESVLFVFAAVIDILPFFVLAVVLASALKATGSDRLVVRVFSGHPVKAILLAAVFGALSPFCSCGVIPLIASMLAAGVPLAPVMAFWIASPIMDPEMFILTSAGISVEFAVAKGLFAIATGITAGLSVIAGQRFGLFSRVLNSMDGHSRCTDQCDANGDRGIIWAFWKNSQRMQLFRDESASIGFFLAKWLILAFFVESLMVAYIDPHWVQVYISGDSPGVVALAAVIGMPSYLNGYAAIPLIGSLIDMGMSGGAAMAFMIAGAVSSIPAAIAVYVLVRKSIFVLYLSLGVSGSFLSGMLYNWFLLATV